MQAASYLSRIGAIGAAMTFAFAVAPSAQAALVTQWAVTANAYFDNVEPGSGISISPTQLWWGTSTGSGQSGLGLAASNAVAVTDGTPGDNLVLTHTNMPITGTSMTKADIITELTLTPLVPPGGDADNIIITFKINFTETTNNLNPCPDGGANGFGIHNNGCADIFVIDQNALNWNFVYDDFTYYISFVEATNGLNDLAASACLAAGAATGCIGFQTPEQATTVALFHTLITSEPVTVIIPEPATLGLFGLALAGMAGVIRRRTLQA